MYNNSQQPDDTYSSGYPAAQAQPGTSAFGGGTHRAAETSTASYLGGASAGPSQHQYRPSNPFARNQQQYGNNSYLSSYQGPQSNPTSSTNMQYQPASNRNAPPQESERRPRQADWDYQQPRHYDPAQSNQYTYTLQQPVTSSRREAYPPAAPLHPQNASPDDQSDDEESELSNYSPNEDIRGFYQN
jgi:hypothetical protein